MKRPSPSLCRSRPLASLAPLPLLALPLALGALFSGCAEPAPRELGFTGAAQDLSQTPDQPFFSEVSEFAGIWVGSAEEPLALGSSGQTPAYHFPSGSSRIVLEIQHNEDGGLTGHIRFGIGEPLPPAVDPDVGYPAGVGYDALLGYELDIDGDTDLPPSYAFASSSLPPFEGFAYRLDLTGAVLSDGETTRLGDGVASFFFSSTEPLAPWCELQTPYPHVFTSGFSCVQDYGGQFESGSNGTGQMCNLWGPSDTSECLPDLSNLLTCIDTGEPVAQANCDKVTMCSSGFCYCDESSCQAAPSNQRLTLRRVGSELVGLFDNLSVKNARGLNTPIGVVRLHLQ